MVCAPAGTHRGSSEPHRRARWGPQSESGGKTIGRTLVTLLLFCVLATLPSLATADAVSPGVRDLAAARLGTDASSLRSARRAAARAYVTRRIARADAHRRYWLRLMHRPVPPLPRVAGLPLTQLERVADRVARRAHALGWLGRHPPHLAGWRCIQQHETAPPYPGWRTASGNGYYGGLQLDRQFQVTYASWLYRSKGTAENWTALEQIWTAEFARAHGRGFAPWPHTATACGLL
jgi:hypothetical protein